MSAQGGAWYPESFKSRWGRREGEGDIVGVGVGRETHPAGLLGRLGIFKGMFSVECW